MRPDCGSVSGQASHIHPLGPGLRVEHAPWHDLPPLPCYLLLKIQHLSFELTITMK